MKLIEALKKLKSLEKKADDIKDLLRHYCCDMDYETPAYPYQKEKVTGWIQAYHDILQEISRLSYQIQKTNLETKVSIELDGKTIEKSITEWILRRRKLCGMELALFKSLTDKNLREGPIQFSGGNTQMAKIRRYYDPQLKERKLSMLGSEPFEIDSKLEIVNATTELVE